MLNQRVKQLFHTHWMSVYVVAGSFICFPIVLVANLFPTVGGLWYAFQFCLTRFLVGPIEGNRRILFGHLEKKFREKNGSPFKVLEIGPGTGENFPFYPSGISITTLERNPVLKQRAAAIRNKYPGLKIDDMLIGNAEDMSMIKDESFDAVVSTHVQCCTPRPRVLVREIHRILKKVCKT